MYVGIRPCTRPRVAQALGSDATFGPNGLCDAPKLGSIISESCPFESGNALPMEVSYAHTR